MILFESWTLCREVTVYIFLTVHICGGGFQANFDKNDHDMLLL